MSSRRTHTKSRTGCINCKRRKVKCDEAFPLCFNCNRNGVPCSLSSRPVTEPATIIRASTVLVERNPPTPASSGISSSASPADILPHVASPGSDQILPCSPQELWSRDLELMHHWCTVASLTFGHREDSKQVWREVIPREGYQNSFVSHGVLSLAAIHKAYLIPSQESTYLALADYHQTVGSESFRSQLEHIHDDNWTQIFSFASLVVLHTLARPPRLEGVILADPITNVCELVGVIRGIRVTVAPIVPRVYRSNLAPMVYGVWPSEEGMTRGRIPTLEYTSLPPDTFEALWALRVFQKSEIPSTSDEHYAGAIESLEKSARAIACAGIHAEVGTILSWPYGVHDSILADMRTRKPHALLLLAYIAVFFGVMDKSFWFVRGWGKGLLREVEDLLSGHTRFLEYLKWPRKQMVELYGLG
ncbi:Fc.00g114130.m01.CDS01 [Cosmosporella sp. VM-42]